MPADNARPPRARVLSFATMRKHPALYPIAAIVTLAVVGDSLFAIRALLKTPEVQYVKRETSPWEDYRDKQFSLYNARGLKRDECPAPKF